MKLKFVLFLIASAVSSSIMAQNEESKKFIDGPDFEKLSITGPIKVELVQADKSSLEAYGSYDFTNALSTSWSKKELHISYYQDKMPANSTLRIFVKNLKSIEVDEGATIVTPDPLHMPDIMLNVKEESTASVMSYGKIRISNPGSVQVKRVSRKM
jgi:hypothetical protein